jgi:hypothetical protein
VLGEHDRDHYWLSQMEQLGGTKEGASAFSAYLGGLSTWNQSFANCRLGELLERGEVTGEAIIRAIAYLPGDLTAVERVKQLLEAQRTDVTTIEFHLLRSSPWLNTLHVDNFLQLLKAIAGSVLEHARAVVYALNTWLYKHTSIDRSLVAFAGRCLKEAVPDNLEDTYKCDRLASKLAEADIESGFDLFEHVLKLQGNATCWNPLSPYVGREFWPTLCKIDRRRSLRIPLSLATNDITLRLSITCSLVGMINQEDDATILTKFAEEGQEQATVVCSCLTIEKAGFWIIAFEIFRRYSTNQEIRELLQNAILRTNAFPSTTVGIPSVKLQSRLDDIQQVLSRTSLSTAEYNWLKKIAGILCDEIELFSQYDSNEDLNARWAVADDPTAPERLGMIRQLLVNGQLDTLRKTVSYDEMLSLLPNLQLDDDDRAKFEQQIKQWK